MTGQKTRSFACGFRVTWEVGRWIGGGWLGDPGRNALATAPQSAMSAGKRAAGSATRSPSSGERSVMIDRLARNVYFIAGLMESKVDFVACDMPDANKTMLQIWAVMAEWERDQISKRTKDALAEKKKQGVRLGNPRPAESLARGRATMSQQRAARLASIRPTVDRIDNLHRQGLSFRAIARELNSDGIPSPTGKQWHDVTVKRAIEDPRA